MGSEDRALKEFFRPELRNRIDAVCKFNKLDTFAIKKIVVKFLDNIRHSLQEHNIRIVVTEAVVEHLAEVGYDSRMGARPLNRKIDDLIRVPLSRKILFDRCRDCVIHVDFVDQQVVFTVRNRPNGSVDDNGLVQVENVTA